MKRIIFLMAILVPLACFAQVFNPSSGTVSNIVTGTGLSGGPISATGTITSNAEDTVVFAPGLFCDIGGHLCCP